MMFELIACLAAFFVLSRWLSLEIWWSTLSSYEKRAVKSRKFENSNSDGLWKDGPREEHANLEKVEDWSDTIPIRGGYVVSEGDLSDDKEEISKVMAVTFCILHDLIESGEVSGFDCTTPKAISLGDQFIAEGVRPTSLQVTKALMAFSSKYGIPIPLVDLRDLILYKIERIGHEVD